MTYRAYRKNGKKTGLITDMASAMRGPVQPQPTAPGRTRVPGPARTQPLLGGKSKPRGGEILSVLGYTVNPNMVANFQRDVQIVGKAGLLNLPNLNVNNNYDSLTQKAYLVISRIMKESGRPLTDWIAIVKKAQHGASRGAGKLRMSTRPPGDVRPSSPRDPVVRTPGPVLTPMPTTPHGGARAAPSTGSARKRVPNRTGNPAGYNNRLFRNNRKILKALNALGYKVKSLGKTKQDMMAIKKFQEDFNRCSRRFSFKWGTVSVNGMVSPDTLRALEIALVFVRQRQKKMRMRGLNRTMAQCWQRCCKRSKTATGSEKAFAATRRRRRSGNPFNQGLPGRSRNKFYAGGISMPLPPVRHPGMDLKPMPRRKFYAGQD